MSRKSNLRHELIQGLRAQDRRGESKFDAKQEAKAAGGKYEQVTEFTRRALSIPTLEVWPILQSM